MFSYQRWDNIKFWFNINIFKIFIFQYQDQFSINIELGKIININTYIFPKPNINLKINNFKKKLFNITTCTQWSKVACSSA